ncbi:hypothetical protein AMJ80_02000 [bacterium SM23_31]|nr:MAG: hypothetical protein AMJ80_02000 [bacterium SM23_31]
MAVKPEIADYINSHAEMVISEAKEVVGTSTNRKVEIELQDVDEFSFDDLSSCYKESVVAIEFKLAGAPDGKMQLFLDKVTAARIGSLMMMEDEDVEFSDDHIDAVKEMTNQILGAISTKMKETEDVSVSFSELNGQEVELSADMFEQPDLIVSKFGFKIDEDEPKIITTVFAPDAIETLMEGGVEAETSVEEGQEEETEVLEEAAATAEGEEEKKEAGEGEEEAEETEEAVEGEEEAEEEAAEDKFDISGVLDGEEEKEVLEEEEEVPEAPVPEVRKEVSDVELKFEFLMDLAFNVSIELGRTKMLIKDILELGHGSVIEFDKLAGEPVDLLIGDKKIGEGEVVILDEHFGIRITNLVHKAQLLRDIGAKKSGF